MFNEIVTLALIFHVATSKIEPKVVKGDLVDISIYAHSAFLFINNHDESFICGASIINQKILLTAAHCIESCVSKRCFNSLAFTGHSHKRMGVKTTLSGYIMHDKYDPRTIHNDIALVLLRRPLKLGDLAKRVAITKEPNKRRVAVLAGWGKLDEERGVNTDYLHYAELKLWTFEDCRKIIPTLPMGCICAGQLHGEKYASEGDSGSALVVDKYIQIGLVSYKRPDLSKSVVAFTDVSYFYDWIKLTAKRIYCA